MRAPLRPLKPAHEGRQNLSTFGPILKPARDRHRCSDAVGSHIIDEISNERRHRGFIEREDKIGDGLLVLAIEVTDQLGQQPPGQEVVVTGARYLDRFST